MKRFKTEVVYNRLKIFTKRRIVAGINKGIVRFVRMKIKKRYK